MEITGKIIELLPQQTGEGKNGTWRKNRFVIETTGQYPKTVCFDVWGDKYDQMPIQVGNDVVVSFDVESRSWNNNWYNDIKAWKVVPAQSQMGQASTQQMNQPMDTTTIPTGTEPNFPNNDSYDDDLPF